MQSLHNLKVGFKFRPLRNCVFTIRGLFELLHLAQKNVCPTDSILNGTRLTFKFQSSYPLLQSKMATDCKRGNGTVSNRNKSVNIQMDIISILTPAVSMSCLDFASLIPGQTSVH